MHKRTIPLTHLSQDKKGIIADIHGGHGLQRKLRVMGIREGETVRIVSRQPLMGPITIAFNHSQITLGRGMAHKIRVEVV
jgi:ferrous iron transport protein A